MNAARWTRLAWGLVPLAYILFLATPSVSLPGDNLGIRGFQTPALSPGTRLGQTFSMTGDGLTAVEIFPVAAGGQPSGTVRFDLYEVAANRVLTPMRRAEVPAEDVVRDPSYRFEFAPVPESKDRSYRLDLSAPEPVGVALWATRGDRYDGGSMHVNGRTRWAELAFQVHAPAPSVWSRLLTLRDRSPVRAYVVLAASAGIWLLLGVALRLLTSIPPESARTGSPRAA